MSGTAFECWRQTCIDVLNVLTLPYVSGPTMGERQKEKRKTNRSVLGFSVRTEKNDLFF